jgi:hypothetical protein
MRCYECGYQNSSDARVCIKCGTKLSNLSAGDSSAPARPSPPSTSAPDVQTSVSPAASGGRPTIMGRAADAPAWDTGKPASGGSPHVEQPATQKRSASVITCSSCGYYPLRSEPSQASPCINCGFTGSAITAGGSGGVTSADTSNTPGVAATAGLAGAASTPSSSATSTPAKTVRLDAIRVGQGQPQPGNVVLTDTVTGKEIEFEGTEIALNRADLDPSNTTISSSHHLTLHLDGDNISLEDKSSNGATFVQAVGKVNVTPGSMLIVGNKVFRIDHKQ